MWTRSLFSPKTEIPKSAFIGLSLCSVSLVLGLWCLLTYGGITPKDFLAAPHEVIEAAIKRIGNLSLFHHIGASLSVILSGFILASIFAVPIGILMGSFRAVQALVEPLTGFMRYIPVSALIPLLILWVGIGIEQKIMVIFLGTFFQQLILISDVSARVSKDLIDCAYTLGANRKQVALRILVPACMPGRRPDHCAAVMSISAPRRLPISWAKSTLKPSTPPESLGMACGANVPSSPTL